MTSKNTKYELISFHIGMWVMLLMFIVTNYLDSLNQIHHYYEESYYGEFSSRLFGIILSVGLTLISYRFRREHWVCNAFFILNIYNIFDEIMGNAYTVQWYEYPIAILTISSSYIKFNYKKWKPLL